MMNDSSVDQRQEETRSMAAEVDVNLFEDKKEEPLAHGVALLANLDELGHPESIHDAAETEGVAGKDHPVGDVEKGNMKSENENISSSLEGSTDAESRLRMPMNSLDETDETATRASECAVVVPVDALLESTPVVESDTPVAKIPTAPSQETRQGRKEIEGKTNHVTPPQRCYVRGQSERSSHPFILALPIDSLHCIASFLYPKEWVAFGQCGKGTGRVCREIFRRVRMHGFRCATEVVTAWKLGQHSDAKELAALYIEAGVPIYPYSLGHSYHTLKWRMEIEAKELQARQENEVAHGNDAVGDQENNRGRPFDRFYSERNEARARDAFSENITYLEEKCLFRLNEYSEDGEGGNVPLNHRRHGSLTMNRMMGRATAIRHAEQDLAGFGGAPMPGRFPANVHSGLSLPRSTLPSRGNLGRSSSQVDMRAHFPKVSVKIHRHLLDQHLLGRPSVDDGDGVMVAAPVSLSADFFHPYFSFRPNQYRQQVATSAVATNVNPSNSGVLSGSYLSNWNHQVDHAVEGLDLAVLNGGMTGNILPDMGAATAGGAPLNAHLPQRRTADAEYSDSDEPPLGHPDVVADGPNAFEMAINQVAPPRRQPLVPPFEPRRDLIPSLQDPHLVLSNVDLEVYSAASSSPNGLDGREAKFHLQQRFAAFHKCLETLLSHDDNVGFQECVLDFWDEFFAQTSNVHYYDRHTAVPRISRLSAFLTKPCPKAIGIVQCEIERIKLNSKKKGVNMKGRFFPTYEYRLFIRHRAPESVEGESPERPRRDTVIMMAKNRGRKQASAGSKKGANNYYLYMPQQEDVVEHFNGVNKAEEPATTSPNGASEGPTPGDVSALLGRLQSNFIGTEFQIFSPRVRKQPPGPSSGRASSRPAYSCGMSSDDDLDYDSGVCSDNPASSRRRSRSRGRFSRLSLRRSSLSTPEGNDEGEAVDTANPARRQIRRTRSSSDVPSYSRPSRTSRRAISNAAVTEGQRPQAAFYEEEDGAITYTANLLGSRPRIMDVCIPKVSNEGPASSEWKKYLENCDDGDGGAQNRMLNRFKQLQQRLENEEQGNVINNEERVPASEAPDGYTPPDDFGLLVLQNRPPWWNIELGSFVLNFGGRVSVASVKNFQLCDRNDHDYIMLQFGRIQGRHSFTMDFQYPLTAVQAFAIAISSLQSKISFG